MKKIVFILVILSVSFSNICYAAIDAATQWEFRSTATANMVNGGGFVSGASGSDFSTQDTAERTWLPAGGDFTNDLSPTNATPSVLTSASYNFAAADVGNIIHLTAGTNLTASWYEIVSVAANAATLDRNAMTGAPSADVSGYEGGSMNIGALEDSFFDNIGDNADDGNTVWFYNNNSATTITFTMSQTVSISGGGVNNPIMIKGYKTTRGDEPRGDDRPTLAIGANLFEIQDLWDMHNLQATGTSSRVLDDGNTSKFISLKVTNSSTTADRNSINLTDGNSSVYDCELISYRGQGIFSNTSHHEILYSYFHDSNVGLLDTSTGGTTLIGNLFESHVTAAVQFTGTSSQAQSVVSNTFYGSENTTGIGLDLSSGSGFRAAAILNNIFYGFVTGINYGVASSTTLLIDYNNYFNNDTDVTNVTKGSNASSADPTFTDVAQVVGTTATYTGSTLTDAGANFDNVVNNQDFIYIVSGTGVTAGQYLITGSATTTVTTDIDAGESAGGDIVFQVTTGRDFSIGTNLKAAGFPGAFQGGLTTGFLDIGAVQREEPAAGGGRRAGWSIQ